MKKTKLLAILFALVLVLALTACGGNKNPVESGFETDPVVTDPAITEPVEVKPTYAETLFSNWQEYEMVYEDGAADIVSSTFVDFNVALGEKYGFIPRANSDFLMPGETAPEGTLEILVGLTNRPESIAAYESLKANDYFIGMINNRLVIVGGSNKATASALKHVMSYLMKDDGLYYPTEGYTYEANYTVDKLTVGGVDISDFVLVRGNGMGTTERNLVTFLCETIADICGANIEIVLPSAKEVTYEILLGNTGRDLTSKELDDGTYAIEQTENKLALYGKGDSCDSFILKYFVEEILFNIPEGESYDIKLENVSGLPFESPKLVYTNLSDTLPDLTDKYEWDVMSADVTLDRFFATVDELPEEVTVLDRVLLENYPVSMQKKQIYVSNANGDDNNNGTKASPYKTINKAVTQMKNEGGGVIWVEGGTYSLTETINITRYHSGTFIAPLFIKSYGDKAVTLTSNIVIDTSEFELVDIAKDPEAARLKDSVKDKVYVVNLFDLGWTEEDIVPITTKGTAKIYFDGVEGDLARFPNAKDENGNPVDSKELLYFKYVYDTGSVTVRDGSNLYWPWIERANSDPNLTPESILGWQIRILNERDALSDKGDGALGDEILSWVNTGDIWYYGSTFEGWEHGYYNIAPDCVHGSGLLGEAKPGGFYALRSVQPSPYGAKVSANSAAGRNTYYLFNAIEALDAPGEWFIDAYTGNLYVYPTGDIKEQTLAYSGSEAFDLLMIDSASNVVIDGIGVNGSAARGIYVYSSNNVIIQDITTKNTTSSSVVFSYCKDSALLYSDLSYSHSSMLSIASLSNLVPQNVYAQNNYFHDTPSTVSNAVSLSGIRAVVSHNLFDNCCVSGSGYEHIIEYNAFEGGNKFVTDGGMVYFSGWGNRGTHVRYNLFHMFNATHQAVYFDTMCSGMYSYYNVISTLGAKTNAHKGWYSSTGHGNVCYANIMVLRNKSQIDALNGVDTDEGTEAIKKGDDINESGLFYYYYGNNASGNSLAGHWWQGMKEGEVNGRLTAGSNWVARYPEYINFLKGTKLVLEAYDLAEYKVTYDPQKLTGKTYTFETDDSTVIWVPPYEYLDENGNKQTMEEKVLTPENGKITVTYDDISAMERLRRQPAFSVIMNNLILGGSTNVNNVITNSAGTYKGLIKDVTIKENNYFEFDYDKIMADAENFNYDISEETWNMIEEKMGKDFVTILKQLDYKKAGLTY